MKILRSTVQDGNVFPIVYNYLRSLPTVALHHTDHSLRHPLAIYSISLERVTNAFSSVLDEYNKLSKVPMNEDDEPRLDFDPLITTQTELLESMQTHIDNSYQILKSLHPPILHPPIKKTAHFANQWLAEAKHPSVANFTHLIKPYRDSFAPIVNKIKHEYGRLQAIWLYCPPGLHIGGYFLEGVDKRGTLGPHMQLHGGNTALSVNRDLRYHFANLYQVDHRLMEAIVAALSKTYNYTFPSSIRVEENSESIERVAERISQLPFFFFPDEVNKPTPTLHFHKDAENVELTSNVNSFIKVSSPSGKMRIITAYAGDGVTTSWRLPYPNIEFSFSRNPSN
jgi:hypothetical protein